MRNPYYRMVYWFMGRKKLLQEVEDCHATIEELVLELSSLHRFRRGETTPHLGKQKVFDQERQ